MLDIFFAERVILNKANFTACYGNTKYIPEPLKKPVADILLEKNIPQLVPIQYGGTLQ